MLVVEAGARTRRDCWRRYVHRHAAAAAAGDVGRQSEFRKGNFLSGPRRIDRPPSAEARSIELLLCEMDQAEIRYGVIMGRQSIEPLGAIPNDEIASCVKAHAGRFLGWAGIDLSQPMDACLKEIRRCIEELGFKGVSIEPSIARDESFALATDRRLYPIYEECIRLDVPLNISLSAVLQSTVDRPYELSNPTQIYQVAKVFPKLDIHVAHGAWPYVLEMIGVCFVCPNVWLSPDRYHDQNGARRAGIREGGQQLFSGPHAFRHVIPEQAAGSDGCSLQRMGMVAGLRKSAPSECAPAE